MRDRLIELIGQAKYKMDYCGNGGRVIRSEMENIVEDELVEDLADYLLENGVIVPPCKVGDMVYVICYGEVVATCVTEFEINPKGIIAKVNADPDIYSEYDIEDIYISEKEAEQAMKARENNGF